MIVKQYAVTLPADYDMQIIRRRVATKGPAFDDFPGLGVKVFMIREKGCFGRRAISMRRSIFGRPSSRCGNSSPATASRASLSPSAGPRSNIGWASALRIRPTSIGKRCAAFRVRKPLSNQDLI